MNINEVLSLIEESKKFLEPYKKYGPMITDGIQQLSKLEKLVSDKEYGSALKMSCIMRDQISGYRNFVPRLADNLDKIREILSENIK